MANSKKSAFLSAHYDKVIVAGVLVLLFVSLFVLLSNAGSDENGDKAFQSKLRRIKALERHNLAPVSSNAYETAVAVIENPYVLAGTNVAFLVPPERVLCAQPECGILLPPDAKVCPKGHEQPDESAAPAEGFDSDGDGLPDAWENAHGLNPIDPDDAGNDPDGDGFTNAEEFEAGTDPNDAASHPDLYRFLRIRKVEVTPFRFRFNGGKTKTKDSYKFTVTDTRTGRDYYVVKGGELADTGFVLESFESEWVERQTNTGKRRMEIFTLHLRKGEDEVVMREREPVSSSVFEVTFVCDRDATVECVVRRNGSFEVDGVALTLVSLSNDRTTAKIRVDSTKELLDVTQ